MPICIAGMHRSGTSMVAKLLHQCGVYLGEEADLMPAMPDNQDGYWEHKAFSRLNDEILNEAGGGWDHPLPLPSALHEADRFRRLRENAKALAHPFASREPWGWKDPRNSVTLPFWLDLFDDLIVVICVRNPLEVAQSLRRRNYLSYPLR